MLKYVLILVVLLLVAAMLYVRFAPIETASYHVDPGSIAQSGADGQFSVAPGGDLEPQIYERSPAEIASALETIIVDTPRTRLVEGALADGQATYMTRSALWGFPDITTIRLEEQDGKTQLTAIGRLVYGQKDFGVNEARVRSWIDALGDP
ncbi:DUF1499 domain-containing protein [Litoreibacter roseus]|uniref:DUF1499 domain-containing protein n=1 Tax=Litoreibacter roseus TaxID=2601869 RepID=A0A6N6JD00_9RHOB|nr:DUF1499 domain-containing protein [Litoreibacter roseus]GFE64046.1 hypothetical protein KIN_11200 [Litoreibacter roseus]